MARYRIVKDIDEKLPGDNIEKYIARDNPEHDEHHKVNYKRLSQDCTNQFLFHNLYLFPFKLNKH